MPVRGQTGAFPPIGGLYQWCTVTHTHTYIHTCFMHLCDLLAQGDWDWIIDCIGTDLEGQQRSLYWRSCLMIVILKRKTIGDLNSGIINATITSQRNHVIIFSKTSALLNIIWESACFNTSHLHLLLFQRKCNYILQTVFITSHFTC